MRAPTRGKIAGSSSLQARIQALVAAVHMHARPSSAARSLDTVRRVCLVARESHPSAVRGNQW